MVGFGVCVLRELGLWLGSVSVLRVFVLRVSGVACVVWVLWLCVAHRVCRSIPSGDESSRN